MARSNDMAKQILALLPGVDCAGFGGCGYPTCAECAQAIAEGASVALCPACDNKAVTKIAKVMGVEPVEAQDNVAFVRCAGTAAVSERYGKCKTCDAAKAMGTVEGECSYGCFGIGSCISCCKFDAMKVEEGKLIIDRKKCTGCEACLAGCCQEIIEMIPREATNFIPCSSLADEAETFETCGYGCIGCGDCMMSCPKGAIEMVMGPSVTGRYAKIDYSKCEGCVTCTVKCRKKIIVDTLHDLTEVKEEVAFVRCVGGAKGSRKLKKMELTSCAQAADVDLDGNDICTYSCAGLGDCVNVCRYDAISADLGVAMVDPDKCVGCGDCMRACPRDKIIMVPYKGVKQTACTSKADPERRMEVCGVGCIGCGDCADNCPSGAITMTDGNPFIDHEKCVNCGVCTYVCSRNLISERKVPEYNYLQMDAMKIEDTAEADERKS